MEYWDLFDESGTPLGRRVRKDDSLKDGEYHFAVEIWIVNRKQQLLIQKRSLHCETLPGAWAFTTGRVLSGETPEAGCLREVREELGIVASPEQLTYLRQITRHDGSHLIWRLYLLRTDIPLSSLSLQQEEVASAKYITFHEMEVLLQTGCLFSYPEIDSVAAQVYSLLQK